MEANNEMAPENQPQEQVNTDIPAFEQGMQDTQQTDSSFNDMLGLASIINACDFVITCSNVNAHMAGALNKKTFLLLPLGKGRLWNWGSAKDSSIWYPSVRIFQQFKPGDWIDPVLKVKKEVLNFLNH